MNFLVNSNLTVLHSINHIILYKAVSSCQESESVEKKGNGNSQPCPDSFSKLIQLLKFERKIAWSMFLWKNCYFLETTLKIWDLENDVRANLQLQFWILLLTEVAHKKKWKIKVSWLQMNHFFYWQLCKFPIFN